MTTSSNVTRLSFAEETSLKVLPGSPVWYDQEPNSYSDFGPDLSMVSRAPIDVGRQQKKGTITDLDAAGGFQIDFTRSNSYRLLQGFFFADARENPTTTPLASAAIPITSTTATTYVAASGLAVFNKANLLILARNFAQALNNGLKKVTSAAAGAITTTGLAVEAAPPANASIVAVGLEGAAGDFTMTVSSGVATLGSTAAAFAGLTLIPGQWIYIGGDGAAFAFATCPRLWARVRSISSTAIVLENCTLQPVADAGAAKTIQIFWGHAIKNEATQALIKRRSYNLERTLGLNSGGVNTQAEYLEGAVPNEFTLNVPGQDKVTADLSFVACNSTYADGTTIPVKVGTHVPGSAEDAYNTTSDTKFLRLTVASLNSFDSALFAYGTEMTLGINNNVNPSKALGILGALDANPGTFEVTGSMTAYFQYVDALQAVRNNADCSVTLIEASAVRQCGYIFDIPLLQLSYDPLQVELNSDIMVPLTVAGAQNKYGHTLLYEFFEYVPIAAAA